MSAIWVSTLPSDLTDLQLDASVRAAVGTVSFFDAAGGCYRVEREARAAAEARLRALRAEAERRGMGITFAPGEYPL